MEPQALVTFGENLPSIIILRSHVATDSRCVLDWQGVLQLSLLLFIQGLKYSIVERFMTTKWVGFESVTTAIEFKQKMLSNWNRIFQMKLFAAKSCCGVNNLWGFWHLLTNLFFSITHLGFNILNSRKIRKILTNVVLWRFGITLTNMAWPVKLCFFYWLFWSCEGRGG